MAFISAQTLASTIGTSRYQAAIPMLMNVLKINKLNQIHDSIANLEGIDFVNGSINSINAQLDFDPKFLERIPKTGAFITISNHPFGLLDGLFLLKILGQVRPDIKLMANFLLNQIPQMQAQIIGVNPIESIKKNSTIGIKNALKHIGEGKPLGIFPAGEVSTFQTGLQGIQDKEWNKSVIKMIQMANVPIIPIYFEGHNSWAFHLLGLIHPLLRTAIIPSEFFTKQNKTIKIRIGKAIMPDEQADFAKDAEKFGKYLRTRTYLLGAGFDKKKKTTFRSIRHIFKHSHQEVIAPLPQHLLHHDIEQLEPQNFLQKVGHLEMYVAEAHQIPNILNEIGRLREITFREVGEGTGKSFDIDAYDSFYQHLFLWDNEAKSIVGAYRLGLGHQIYDKHGRNGFYINQFYTISKSFDPILKQTLEMGRLFIAKKYQKQPMPLLLLWRGVISIVHRHNLRYLLGTVSISNDYTAVSKTMLVRFIQKYFYDETLGSLIQPHHLFKPAQYSKIDMDIVIEKLSEIEQLDRLISEIEVQGNKMPVLVRKYIKMNAKSIAFSIDPSFGNTLDILMLLGIDSPNQELMNLLKI